MKHQILEFAMQHTAPVFFYSGHREEGCPFSAGSLLYMRKYMTMEQSLAPMIWDSISA